MTTSRAALLFGAMLTCFMANSAKAQISCHYSQQKQSGVAVGLTLEQGSVTCGAHTGGVSILQVDMTTPGRAIATTTPPAIPPSPAPNDDHYVGKTFVLQLPTHYVEPKPPNPKPIVYPKSMLAQAVVDGNLSTNCCVYVRKNAATKATWLRGLEISNGRVNTPVKGNSSVPCVMQSNNKCYAFEFDASLLIDRAGHATIQKIDTQLPLLDVQTAVTGSHMLVQHNNVVVETCPAGGCTGEFYGPNSRTAVGLIGSRTMLVVAVDSTGSGTGLQLDELATFLHDDLHADAAINLDGGGSTVMGVRRVIGGQIVNRPRDGSAGCDQPAPRGGCERYVGNALVIGVVPPISGHPAHHGRSTAAKRPHHR